MPVLDEKILRGILEDRAYQQRKGTRDAPMKHIILFFLIMFGVASGNLLSNWITAKVAAYQLEKSLQELSATLRQQDGKLKAEREARAKRDANIKEEQRQHQEQQKRNREASEQARQKLVETCRFWIKEYQRTGSEADRNHRTNACRDAGITVGK